MDLTLTVQTDCASFAVFDPVVAASCDSDDIDQFEFEAIKAVAEGLLFAWKIGGDGVYRVRVTDGDLTAEERDYASARLPGLGLKVESGTVCISGYGFQGSDVGLSSFRLGEGCYSIEVYEILWSVSPDWWRPDFVVPPDAPSDYVMRITTGPDSTPKLPVSVEDLHLDTLYLPFQNDPPFLFPSTTRKVGTPMGAELTSVIIKSSNAPQGLRLKECGIEGYKADLNTYDGLVWHDRVRFRVTAIDHDQMLFVGELIEKLPPET